MQRPSIKDKEVLKYVEYLEKQLDGYKSDRSVAKSYLAIKKFVDEMNELIIEGDFQGDSDDVILESDQEKQNTKKRKSLTDKLIERGFRYIDSIDEYNEKMEIMEKRVNPEIIKEVKKEAGSVLEDVLRERIQDE